MTAVHSGPIVQRVGDGLNGHERVGSEGGVSEVPLNMRARIANGVANVAISGGLDRSSAAKLEAVLREVERVDDVERIWLDMRGLEFIDSTGVSVLCDAIDRARMASDRLCLTGTPSSAVRRLLEVAGIAERLPTEWRGGAAATAAQPT